MIRNLVAEAVDALDRAYPAWQIWTVPRAAGGQIWCARRRDDHKRLVNALSPQELARALVAAERR